MHRQDHHAILSWHHVSMRPPVRGALPVDRGGAMLLDVAKLPREGEAFDVVVIGAGGAGMSAACRGDRWSAGVAGRAHRSSRRNDGLLRRDHLDTRDAARRFGVEGRHAGECGHLPDSGRSASARRGAAQARSSNRAPTPRSCRANSEVKYRAYPLHPDYLTELQGRPSRAGRSSRCRSTAASWAAVARVRPPIPEFTVLGAMMVDRNDIFHLLRLTKTFASFRYSAKILRRH